MQGNLGCLFRASQYGEADECIRVKRFGNGSDIHAISCFEFLNAMQEKSCIHKSVCTMGWIQCEDLFVGKDIQKETCLRWGPFL